ncbi:unnamed protein product, partial [Ectocarpus fasciculatus]
TAVQRGHKEHRHPHRLRYTHRRLGSTPQQTWRCEGWGSKLVQPTMRAPLRTTSPVLAAVPSVSPPGPTSAPPAPLSPSLGPPALPARPALLPAPLKTRISGRRQWGTWPAAGEGWATSPSLTARAGR